MHVMFITKLRNTSKPNFSHQDSVVFFSYNSLRLISWRLILMMMLWRLVVELLWLMTILLSLRLKLLLNWLVWWVILLLIIRWLMLLLFKSLSLRLMIRIHRHVLAGRVLMLLHVFETIIVNFNVDFPVWMLLINFFNDLSAKFFITSDHDKSITKSVECSSCVSFDDSKG